MKRTEHFTSRAAYDRYVALVAGLVGIRYLAGGIDDGYLVADYHALRLGRPLRDEIQAAVDLHGRARVQFALFPLARLHWDERDGRARVF